MTDLPHQLTRTVVIRATPATVFRFFTDSARWAAWWGAGSTIDPRPGGDVYVRYPNGVEARGAVLEVQPANRIAFTYGFVSGTPIPPGSSVVTIRLEPHEGGTRLHLLHEFADARARDEHVQGWRFQLSLFANVVANEVHAGAGATVDEWFRAWSIPDERERADVLSRIATPTITFRDRFSLLDGMPDLVAHTGAAQRFMPGIRMHRRGDVRQCQGTLLADWSAVGPDGAERMAGTNVFALHPDGRIESVVGFGQITRSDR